MAVPLLDIDTQHTEMIHDAQLDYYAKRLATCSSDTTVRIYDIHGDQQYAFAAELRGHEGPVWEVAWAHPKFGTVLASCGFDGRVIVHREQAPGQWQAIYTFTGMDSSVNAVSWAPHEYDLCLACVSSDGSLAVLSHASDDSWNFDKVSASSHGLNAVSWAPFGAASQPRERRLVTGGCDCAVRVWVLRGDDPASNGWQVESELQPSAHADWVRDVAWAPSIGLPCNSIASCSEDGKVVVWTQQQQTPGADWAATVVRDVPGTPVWRVSWSITGSVLAVSAGDAEVTLWKEAAEGRWVQISDVNEATAGALAAGYQRAQQEEEEAAAAAAAAAQQEQQQQQYDEGYGQQSQPQYQQQQYAPEQQYYDQQPPPQQQQQPAFQQQSQPFMQQGGFQQMQAPPPPQQQQGGFQQPPMPPQQQQYGGMPPPPQQGQQPYGQAPPPQMQGNNNGMYGQAPPRQY